MTANIPFAPFVTTNALGSFNTDATGYVQGTAMDSPNARFNLAGGYVSNNETYPMWGGIGISEMTAGSATPLTSPLTVYGGQISRATTLTNAAALSLTGFTVFDQAHAMVNTPSSPVPLAGSYMSVNFYRLGSGARIAVQCSPGLVNQEGVVITNQVSWDFANQQLTPYTSVTISSATYNGTTGVVTATTSAATGLAVGDTFEVSGTTGTGAFASNNGEWTVGVGTTGTTLVYTIPASLTLTITGGNVSTGGVLAAKVLDVRIGNCMTVNYNTTSGAATWNRSGNCALILI